MFYDILLVIMVLLAIAAMLSGTRYERLSNAIGQGLAIGCVVLVIVGFVALYLIARAIA